MPYFVVYFRVSFYSQTWYHEFTYINGRKRYSLRFLTLSPLNKNYLHRSVG